MTAPWVATLIAHERSLDGGLCELCRTARATAKCPICGRSVCSEDWSGSMCIACSATLCQLCGARLSVGYCAECGRLVCEVCSKERGVARLCLSCSDEPHDVAGR